MSQQQLLSDGKEIWESTIPGRIAVIVSDDRGRERTVSVAGKKQRLRLTALERQINEERVRDPQNNPFRNGMLICINRDIEPADGEGDPNKVAADVPSDNELSDEDLAGLFELDAADFEATIGSLSEVNVRRLKDLAGTADAKASQIGFLNDFIAEHWPVGGDTPTYREMQAPPAGTPAF